MYGKKVEEHIIKASQLLLHVTALAAQNKDSYLILIYQE